MEFDKKLEQIWKEHGGHDGKSPQYHMNFWFSYCKARDSHSKKQEICRRAIQNRLDKSYEVSKFESSDFEHFWMNEYIDMEDQQNKDLYIIVWQMIIYFGNHENNKFNQKIFNIV